MRPDLKLQGAPKTEEALFSRTYTAVTVSLAAVMFLTGFAALAVVPTLPVAARALRDVPLYPLVAGCFVAASLLGGLLGGTWADRAGARRPLAAAVVLAVVTLLVSATSVSIWQLAAGRFLDGIAGGMVAVCVNTAIGQAYPEHLRPRALALMSTAWIIPSLIGPPLAGLVDSWWSWRAVFYGLAMVNVVPAVAVTAALRGGSRGAAGAAGGRAAATGEASRTGKASGGSGVQPSARSRPPLAIAATVSLGAAIVQYGASGGDLGHLLLAGIGIAALAGFAWRLLPPGTARAARGLPATVLLRGLSSGAYFTLEAFVPLWLDNVRHVPTAETGLAFTGAALAWAVASWAQGRVLSRFPRHRLVAVGALVLAAAVGTAVFGTLPGGPTYIAGAALVAAAVGMGLLVPSLTVLSLTASPADRQGYASSAMQTAQNVGQVMILALASIIFESLAGPGAARPAGYAAAFALLSVPSVLAVLLAARTRRA
jgi:MFS family permease